jgi:hypothetical protein
LCPPKYLELTWTPPGITNKHHPLGMTLALLMNNGRNLAKPWSIALMVSSLLKLVDAFRKAKGDDYRAPDLLVMLRVARS